MTRQIQQALLVGGILSSVLYAALTALVPLGWEGYDSLAQVVSELSAVGAPTRRLWLLLCVPYTVVLTGFGWAVWTAGEGTRPLRVTGALITAYGLLGVVWPFAPMHMRGAPFGLTDALHIALGGITVTLSLAMFAVGAFALGRGFRAYSIGSFVVYAVFGALTGIESPKLARNLPTPWLGLWERVCLAVFLVWVVVLAISLLRRPGRDEARAGHLRRSLSGSRAAPPGSCARRR